MSTTKIRRAPARANKKPSRNRTKGSPKASPPHATDLSADAVARASLSGPTRAEEVRDRLRDVHMAMGQLAERIRFLAGDLELARGNTGMSLGQAFTEAMTEVWRLELTLES